MPEATAQDGASPPSPGDRLLSSPVPADKSGDIVATECFFSDACILAVDDEQSNLILLDAMLSRWGYSKVVLTTESSRVSALCADLSPDLILLDLHMPGPSGFDLLLELSPLTNGGVYDPVVPIVVISADLTDEARARALSMGASDFIAKPFNAIETSLRVRNLLKMRRLYRDVTAHNRLLQQHLRGGDAASAHMAPPPRTMDRRHVVSPGADVGVPSG